jgi:DNA-binding CsgD family transcriptional regulator
MDESPYIVSNWVQGANFYGRAELCHLLTTTPERCIYLAGTRRVGKTSLLLRLAEALRPHAAYCDLMRAAGSERLDEERLIALMRRQLAAQAPQSAPLQESRAVWDQQSTSLCGWLEEAGWQWEQHGLTVTLLWDEAELLRRLPDSTLMPLRAILQHSDGLRIILCASKGLADLNDRWRGEHVSPFLFGFRTCYLAGLTDQEAEELIRQRGQIQVSPQANATIRAWTGNHPFLLQNLCSALFGQGRLRQPEQRDLMVDAMLADLFRIDVGYLSPGDHAILRTLATHGPLSLAGLTAHTRIPEDLARSFVAGLGQLGMLRAAPQGCWDVGNAFLAQWLRGEPTPPTSAITDQASLEVIDLAQQPARAEMTTPHQPQPPISPPAVLSDRERMVLRLVAAGMTNQEIARELTIALDTVKAHLKHISSKLGAQNRAQAVARATELGLI